MQRFISATATVDNQPYAGKDIYLAGQLTDYAYNDKTKMVFNNEKECNELNAMLKQGYYNYSFIAVDKTIRRKNNARGRLLGNREQLYHFDVL